MGNLDRHSEIGFTTAGEDKFFGYEVQSRLLPTREQIRRFNNRWSATTPRPHVLGLHNPVFFGSVLSWVALVVHGGVRAILIACDPLSRLEKLFYERASCEPGLVQRRLAQEYAVLQWALAKAGEDSLD